MQTRATDLDITACSEDAVSEHRSEFEMKLYLKGSQLPSAKKQIAGSVEELAKYNNKEGTELVFPLGNIEELARFALERYYLSERIELEHFVRINGTREPQRNYFLREGTGFKFQIRPLKSVLEHYHEGSFMPAWYGNIRWSFQDKALLPAEYFTAHEELEVHYTLASGPYYKGSLYRQDDRWVGDDHLDVKLLVGAPNEVSYYFDTPEGELEQAGFAARIKRWSTGKNGVGDEPKKMMMIKKVVGNHGDFLHRLETPKPLDAGLPDAESDEVMLAFIQKELSTYFPEGVLKRIVKKRKVTTRRLGVPLEYTGVNGAWQKVGFFSFDQYSTEELLSAAGPKNSFTEVEIEIDPQFIDFIHSPEIFPEFTRFVEDFKKTFDAAVTDLHKHQVREHSQVLQSVR